MYRKILIALEHSTSDKTLLPHVEKLAGILGSELLLLHVADGWAARTYDQLKLNESDEMRADRKYLEDTATDLRARGLQASLYLALGNPPNEIVKTAETEGCDLIAMGSHGHGFLGDILFGSTIHEVRHKTTIPVLVVHTEKQL
jgi:nucleotide-binding universal stress UspA family protein